MADPGWYPQQDGSRRYWDGTAWTNHLEDTAVIPPVPSPVPSSGATKTAWFKTRTAIGVGGVLLGLVVGGQTVGTDTGKTDKLSANIASLKATNEELEADVEVLRDDSIADQAALDEQIKAAVHEANLAAEEKRKIAVAKAIAEERRKADARVAAAEEGSADDAPLGLTGGTGGGSDPTDPRFDTCGEALDAGYGHYQEGVDPEYDWYQDRDNDGIVCE